jgi:response regulator RpfG family c-di-GMP phosphodiesterase
MKKKILVVEDDNFFREALKMMLSKYYEVIEAPHGKQAKELIILAQPDVILSDIQMPFLNGVELLEWLNEYKKIPIILMTGFSKILETQKAHDLGVSNFLAKPFEESELLDRLNKIFGPDPSEEKKPEEKKESDVEDQFCKISIDDFISEKETDYGIFVKVGEKKFIKIAHKGGKLSEDKIQTYKDKGINFLYIKQNDFAKLVGFSVQITRALGASGRVDKEKKMRFMKYTGEMIVQQGYKLGVDDYLFANTKDFLTSSIDIFSEDNSSFTLLESLASHSDALYAHAVSVSILSVLIGKQMGIKSPQTIFKLALGGLFHDIGEKEIPTEILKKTRTQLTHQERALIESHTTRGRDILELNKAIPSEVILIAYEHHEDNNGQGYPQGLSKERIHPLTRIVSLANAVVEYVIPVHEDQTPKTFKEAIDHIDRFKRVSFDQEAFSALKKTLKKV